MPWSFRRFPEGRSVSAPSNRCNCSARDIRRRNFRHIAKLSRQPRSAGKLCSYHIGLGVGVELERSDSRAAAGYLPLRR